MDKLVLVLIIAFHISLISGSKFLPEEGACDPDLRPRVITEFPTTINSPSYPDDYPANSLCEWQFSTETENVVVGLFFTEFSVEECTNCTCDYIEAFDGVDDSGRFLGRFCGSGAPIVQSIGQDLFLRFVSDDSSEFAGFRAVASERDPGCGIGKPVVISEPAGNISSENYPNDYPNNLDCGWRFEAPRGSRIQFDVVDFETEPSCYYDYLQVFDGPDASAPRISYHFGEEFPPVVVSTSNVLYVEFRTDSSVTYRGFLANYLHF